MQEGQVICPECKGKKYYRKRVCFKNKYYYYYSKCTFCSAEGTVDWVKALKGRIKGEWFFDSNPAGSLIMDGSEDQSMGGSSIYDGKKYIPLYSDRGLALHNHFWKDEDD